MALRPIRTKSDPTRSTTGDQQSDEVEAIDTVKPTRGVRPPASMATSGSPSSDAGESSAPPTATPTSRADVGGRATVADSTSTGVEGRAAELSSTLDTRVRAAMPQAKPITGTSPTSETAAVTNDAADSAPVSAGGGAMPSGNESAWGWDASIGGAGAVSDSGGTDESTLELVRETLAGTGRYDDVDNMSEQELADAMADEATRAYIGYEGPMDTATAVAWAEADAAAQQEQQMRDYLISEGYDPAEVNMMDSETLALYTQAEAEVALSGGEGGPPSGSGGGPQGGSMNLSDRESGTTQMGSNDDSATSSDDGGSTSGDAGGDGGKSGGESGDDDDDDDDDDGTAPEDTAVTGSDDDEASGNEQGSGAAPESSTPHPDHDSYNPAEKAAFLASKVGAGSRESDMDAIANARGGGLIVGGEDAGDRRAWFESDMSAGERGLASRAVSTSRGGGVTDPVDGDEGAEGLSEVDVSQIPNFGLIDPVDEGSGGGSPVDPITGLPGPVPGGFSLSDSVSTLDLGGAGALLDGVELDLEVDDLDL